MKKLFCLLISVIAFSVFGAVMVSADGGEVAERQSNVFNKLNSISDTDIVAVSTSDLIGARHFLSDSLGKIYFSSSTRNYGYFECYPVEETLYVGQVDCTYSLKLLNTSFVARDFHGADEPYFEVSLSSNGSQLNFIYKYFQLSGDGQLTYTYSTSMPNISTIYVTKYLPTFTKPLAPTKDYRDLQEPFKEPTNGYTDDGAEPPKPSDYIGKDNDGDGDVDWIDMILAPILCVIDTIKFYLEKVRAFIKGFGDTLYVVFKQMFVPSEEYFSTKLTYLYAMYLAKFPFVGEFMQVAKDLNTTLSNIQPVAPSLEFTAFGTKCTFLNVLVLESSIGIVRAIVGGFLSFAVLIGIVKSLPSTVSNMASLGSGK